MCFSILAHMCFNFENGGGLLENLSLSLSLSLSLYIYIYYFENGSFINKGVSKSVLKEKKKELFLKEEGPA